MRRKFYEFEAKVDSIFSHVGLTQSSCRGTYFGDNYKIGNYKMGRQKYLEVQITEELLLPSY